MYVIPDSLQCFQPNVLHPDGIELMTISVMTFGLVMFEPSMPVSIFIAWLLFVSQFHSLVSCPRVLSLIADEHWYR
jgi:hypothetical protein